MVLPSFLYANVEGYCITIPEIFWDKKKRGGISLLSRVEVSELRLWWTADPPRPFQLYPVPQFSALGPGRGTSTPALFLDVFWPSDSAGLRPLSRRFPELALLSPLGSSGLRLPNSGPSAAEAASDPDLSKPKLLRSFRLSISVSCFQSGGLVRFAPPGVYLKGLHFPFESPFNGTTGVCRARSGRHAQYHVSTYSVVRYPPYGLSAGRPSGRRVSSNGGLKLLL